MQIEPRKDNDHKEELEDVKQQQQEGEPKKGYNEKNPGQDEGAFTPDGKDDETPDEAPRESVK